MLITSFILAFLQSFLYVSQLIERTTLQYHHPWLTVFLVHIKIETVTRFTLNNGVVPYSSVLFNSRVLCIRETIDSIHGEEIVF